MMTSRKPMVHLIPVGVIGLSLLLGGRAVPRIQAGGPIFGQPAVWDTSRPIPFTPDEGPLGLLSNEEAVSLVAALFTAWSDVETAALSFAQAGQLGVDVTGSNYMQVVNALAPTVSPVIFDADGSITDALFGLGARRRILGFAGPRLGTSHRIQSALAVLNGAFLDGQPDPGDLPLSLYRAVFLHEFGHYIGLDHSQVNLAEAFDADPTNDAAVPTMLPVLTTSEQATLHADDRAAVSSLYPGPRRALEGTIRGRILWPSGHAGALGVNVVARRRDAPQQIAVSTVTGYGYLTEVTQPPGFYELVALPPGRYTVEVERIHPIFRGGSGVGPFSPPLDLGAPPEFFSGAEESDHDDPTAKVELTVAPGAVIEGVDIILNAAAPPARNNTCERAREIESDEFTDIVMVDQADRSMDDPPNSCSPLRDRTVWYRFVAPTNGTMVLDTYGSTYDTVIGVYRGRCGQMIELSCNDNASFTSLGWFPESQLSVNVLAGQSYYIEVSRSTGGFPPTLLRFHGVFHAAVNGPDLALHELRVASTRLVRGSEAVITFTVVNQGDRPAPSAHHEVRLAARNFRLSVSPPVASVMTHELQPGQADHFLVRVTIPDDLDPGDYFLGVVLDVGNAVAESLEGNNITSVLVHLMN